jgi:endonuclease/exonuclease/phosphatase family metal-dependent hydrolase
MKKVTLLGIVAWILYFSLGIMNTAVMGAVIPTSDDFNGNSLDTTKWAKSALFSGTTDSSIGVFDTNQQLQIGPLFSGTAGSHYNGIILAARYDLTGAYAAVQLVQGPSASTTADAMFTVGSDVNNFYRVYVEAGNLVVQRKIGSAKSVLLSIPYDSAAHSFWRVRHNSSSNTVVFETAPVSGGVPGSWTQRYSEAWNAAIDVTSLLVELKGGTWQTESINPGTVIFDNFSTGSGTVVPPPPPPPNETVLIADDFSGASLDTAKWSSDHLFSGLTDGTLITSSANQQFQVGPLYLGLSGSHYNGITSNNSYDFTGAYCYVQLVKAGPSNTNADSMLTIGNSGSYYYRFYVSGGQLVMLKMVGGAKTTLATTSYDAVNQNFLRVRHDATGSIVVFETAPTNGGAPGTWTQRYSESWNNNIMLSNMRFEVKGGTWQAETIAPGTIIFDNFRVAKPTATQILQTPQVSIAASTLSGNAALPVNFSANASSGNGSIVSYSWNFGDGHSSSLQSPSNTYQSAGQYTAVVNVIDNAGVTASASIGISVSNQPAPPTGSTIKWLTWNTQFTQGTDNVRSLDRIATYITKYAPDVVSLCEFEKIGNSGVNQVDQIVALLQQKTGITYSASFQTKYPGGNEGNLLLSRFAAVSTNSLFLSANRSVVEMTVIVNGRTVNLFGTHLDDATQANRLVEIAQMQAFMNSFGGNGIVAGDLNASPDQTEIQTMLTWAYSAWGQAVSAGTASAYPDNPVGTMTRTRRGQLDHIFYTHTSPNLTLLSSQIPDLRDLSHTPAEFIGTTDDLGVRPSDHNMVIATFRVN